MIWGQANTHAGDPSVVTNCFLGLQHMASQGFHMPKDVVGVVVDAMSNHPHDAEMQLQAIRLIHCLAIADGITKARAADLYRDFDIVFDFGLRIFQPCPT